MISRKRQKELRDRLTEIAQTHYTDRTNLGECTCYGCPERGWMPWETYHQHLVERQMTAFGAALWADTILGSDGANGDDE